MLMRFYFTICKQSQIRKIWRDEQAWLESNHSGIVSTTAITTATVDGIAAAKTTDIACSLGKRVTEIKRSAIKERRIPANGSQ